MADPAELLVERCGGTRAGLAVLVEPARLGEALRWLRDVGGFRYYVCGLASETAAGFEVLHAVRNLETRTTLFCGTSVPRERPELPSAAFLWAGAEWHEREIFDLFGVVFAQHPDLRRLLLPAEYTGHPLRKEFPMDAPWGYRPATRGPGAA